MVCPECGSERLFKDGLRNTNAGQVQRFLCRVCGYRFSEKNISSQCGNNGTVQVCALEKAKNLTEATINKIVAGEGIDQTQQGLIVEFIWKMKKRNKANSTIENRILYLRRLVKLGADLRNTESVENCFCTEEWTDSAKHNAVKAYKAFCKVHKIEWEPIITRYEPKEPFYPQEEEIDILVNACSKVTAAFLQVAKDTGARCGEIRKIEWTDVDDKNNTIAINHPEKGSKTRTIKVTEKTIAMLKNLKKNHGKHVFNPTFLSSRKIFNRTREKMAKILDNPRLLQIHFHTLRHWRASKEYEQTGDIYEVKKLTGHKCLSNVDRYQHGSYSNGEYITKRPQTSQEEDDLISIGFEFVRFDNSMNVPIYRKRK